MHSTKAVRGLIAGILAVFFIQGLIFAQNAKDSKSRELEEMQKDFEWWPTDAKPAPVKDKSRGGYWWWPVEPGKAAPWGNRGYVYVYKIIYDYKEDELPEAKPSEMRPSLLIKKIIKNVKIYFDYNKSELREDARDILKQAAGILKRNEGSSILVTGNCDIRGTEAYNEKLGRQRAQSVRAFMLEQGIPDGNIRIVSRGKLDAIAPVTDLVGMQKDRNAQFMIAQVEEVMIPAPPYSKAEEPQLKAELEEARKIGEDSYIIEEEKKIESEVKVSTREYTIKKGDSLWNIAARELGSGHRWEYLYQVNKDRIKNPNKLKAGEVIIIPVE